MESMNNYYSSLNNVSEINFNDIKIQVEKLKNAYDSFLVHEGEFSELMHLLMKDARKNVKNLACSSLRYIIKREEEIKRVRSMYEFDSRYMIEGLVCGADEVGRGPLAGPIVAASVILDLTSLKDNSLILGIKDSKKLTAKLREELAETIKSKAVSYNIVQLDNKAIDEKGIAWCNNEVLKASATGLYFRPNLVISDGYKIKGIGINNEFVIRGDEKSASIACASIIAKVYRDSIMKELSKIYNKYGFDENSGYGTKDHIEAIKKYGPCEIHRASFLKNIVSDKN